MKNLLTIVLLLSVSLAVMGQESPYQGDNFMTLLGLRKTNGHIAKMNLYIGGDPDGKGVKLTIVDNICIRVDIYNDNNPWGPNIKRFQGELPKGLTFEDKIPEAKQKLGNGFNADGDVFSNYFVSKTFLLESNDTCLMNLEYTNGRLTTVSLAYIKSAANEKEEEKKNAPEPPIYGEDILIMIKKNQYNHEYVKLTQTLGYPSYADRYVRVYADGGVEFHFNKDKQIEWVYLYSGGVGGAGGQNMSKYKLPLPYGAEFGESQSSIMSKLGQPDGTEGNMIYYNENYARVYYQFLGGKLSIVKVGINPDFEMTPRPTKKPERKD